MIAYQLAGFDHGLGQGRSRGEAGDHPSPGFKWNNLGGLYQSFYERFSTYSLRELQELFKEQVTVFVDWLASFSEEDVFTPGSRKWASSTPSNWRVWRWVHINTVSPFKSFRSKIRKWKKLNASV